MEHKHHLKICMCNEVNKVAGFKIALITLTELFHLVTAKF